MIRIRYADLPEGLHVQTASRGASTIIYLRPGLTPGQRREGLARARRDARMGCGPRLPAAGVALAPIRIAVVPPAPRVTSRTGLPAGAAHRGVGGAGGGRASHHRGPGAGRR